MFSLRALVPLFAGSILLVVPAEATTSYYAGASGEALFNTAVGSLTLLNPAFTFSGDLEENGLLNAAGTSIDFLGFDTAFIFNSPISFTLNAGRLIGSPSEVVKIALPAAGIYALGFHITVTSGTANWCIDVTQTGCSSSVSNSSPANAQFVGFVSPTPVSAPLYIHYTGGNPSIVFTNFEAYSGGADTAVPEPGTLLLAGLGFVILRLSRRKNPGSM